jgi:hypothetical protein
MHYSTVSKFLTTPRFKTPNRPVQAEFDPKAGKARIENFIDLRFVDELKKSGFLAQVAERN